MTAEEDREDPAQSPPLEHLRAAALEFVRAGQVLLAVAEKTLEDPSTATDVVQRLAETGREFFAGWTGPGTSVHRDPEETRETEDPESPGEPGGALGDESRDPSRDL